MKNLITRPDQICLFYFFGAPSISPLATSRLSELVLFLKMVVLIDAFGSY